jgi:hypothetical protein
MEGRQGDTTVRRSVRRTTGALAGRHAVAAFLTDAVTLLTGCIDVLLVADFVLRAAGVPEAVWNTALYRAGHALAAPLDGIFTMSTGAGTVGVVRWADLLAVIVSTLVGLCAVEMIRMVVGPEDATAT